MYRTTRSRYTNQRADRQPSKSPRSVAKAVQHARLRDPDRARESCRGRPRHPPLRGPRQPSARTPTTSEARTRRESSQRAMKQSARRRFRSRYLLGRRLLRNLGEKVPRLASSHAGRLALAASMESFTLFRVIVRSQPRNVSPGPVAAESSRGGPRPPGTLPETRRPRRRRCSPQPRHQRSTSGA